jgi:hypothetical protein
VDVKKVLLLIALAVLVYALIAHPTQLADGVQAVFGWIVSGIEAIVAFFRGVVS